MTQDQYRVKVDTGGKPRYEKFSAFDDAAIRHCLALRKLGTKILTLEHEHGQIIQDFRKYAQEIK